MKKFCYIILILFSCLMTVQAQLSPIITPDNAMWIVQQNQIGEGYLNEFIYSPDGQTMLFAGSLGLWRYDVATPDVPPQRIGTNALYSVNFNSTGTLAATGGVLGMVEIWDVATWTPLFIIPVHTHSIRQVHFSPDGSQLVAIAGDTAQILDVATGTILHSLTGHKRPVYDVAYNPEGTQIATASFDDTVKLWDALTGELLITITENTESVLCVKYNPEGNLVASSSYDGMVRVFNSTTGELLQTLEGHTEVPYEMEYTEDGKTLFTIAQDNTVCSWDVATGDVNEVWEVPPVSEFTQSPDGRIIMLNSYENPVRVWDLETDETLFTFDGVFLPPFHAMTYNPDDEQLRTGAFDDGVWVWNVTAWELLEVVQGEMERSEAIATSPDGRLLAVALDNGDIALNTPEGETLARLIGHTMPVVGLAFTPDSRQLISVGSDGTIRVWGCSGNCTES